MDVPREGRKHVTAHTHIRHDGGSKVLLIHDDPQRSCFANFTLIPTEAGVIPSGLIPMLISPLNQHGLTLWKHALEVSIDYFTHEWSRKTKIY